MNIAIIQYNAGNIHSVYHALKRLGTDARITGDKETLSKADKIIFPGVGEAATTMNHLVREQLDTFIRELRQPVLGICLGMQLLCRHSEEGDAKGLGIFPVDVKRFKASEQKEKIPHVGWNSLTRLQGKLFNGLKDGCYAYFVHSYYVPVNEYTAAQTEYILPFSAAMQKDNFYATQFHPEKSGSVGEKILKNFLEL